MYNQCKFRRDFLSANSGSGAEGIMDSINGGQEARTQLTEDQIQKGRDTAAALKAFKDNAGLFNKNRETKLPVDIFSDAKNAQSTQPEPSATLPRPESSTDTVIDTDVQPFAPSAETPIEVSKNKTILLRRDSNGGIISSLEKASNTVKIPISGNHDAPEPVIQQVPIVQEPAQPEAPVELAPDTQPIPFEPEPPAAPISPRVAVSRGIHTTPDRPVPVNEGDISLADVPPPAPRAEVASAPAVENLPITPELQETTENPPTEEELTRQLLQRQAEENSMVGGFILKKMSKLSTQEDFWKNPDKIEEYGKYNRILDKIRISQEVISQQVAENANKLVSNYKPSLTPDEQLKYDELAEQALIDLSEPKAATTTVPVTINEVVATPQPPTESTPRTESIIESPVAKPAEPSIPTPIVEPVAKPPITTPLPTPKISQDVNELALKEFGLERYRRLDDGRPLFKNREVAILFLPSIASWEDKKIDSDHFVAPEQYQWDKLVKQTVVESTKTPQITGNEPLGQPTKEEPSLAEMIKNLIPKSDSPKPAEPVLSRSEIIKNNSEKEETITFLISIINKIDSIWIPKYSSDKDRLKRLNNIKKVIEEFISEINKSDPGKKLIDLGDYGRPKFGDDVENKIFNNLIK